MRDRELLELAAKAVGSQYKDDYREAFGLYCVAVGSDGYEGWRYWNPLIDDGDALRLAVNLRLIIRCYEGSIMVDGGGISTEEHDLSCRCAATRRAIVRAAAEIGRAALAQEQGESDD